MSAPCGGSFPFCLNSYPFSGGGLETPELRYYKHPLNILNHGWVALHHCNDRKFLALEMKILLQINKSPLHYHHGTKLEI